MPYRTKVSAYHECVNMIDFDVVEYERVMLGVFNMVEDQGADIIPEVASSYKPVKGMMFSSTDQAFDFYSEYAKKAGLGVRKGGSYMHDGVLKTKYFTCYKECQKPAKMYDSKVYDFVEGHNHSMVADSDMQFSADEISKSNYLEFGDIISFDATFKTNNMTVGTGLLASEIIESYTWLLQILLKSSSSSPKVVVTDQDPAMKQAIASVGADLCNNEDFKRRICDIVWTDSISPFEFEEKWQAIMVEFDNDKNKWLTDMYEIIFDWIPAFYIDEPLSGLMRTTSRSESENHFFSQATNFQLTLVEFFNHFDFRMEIQRYNGRRCDHDSRYRNHIMIESVFPFTTPSKDLVI
ncbi:protein FAR1-RELATED SEQUENCE 6-like [Bidens hawaiensis]|uniref:protein FAR1-RELATED SEQUENCE 6-like n=1 Tax=Bidens hawaiensis TaxID=980011 RepID=UPI00404AE32D